MQFEHMGAGTWSTAFILIDISSRSFLGGCLTFREYKPKLWREGEGADAASVPSRCLEGVLVFFALCPHRGCGSGGFCGVSDARGAWLGTWCLRVPVDVCMVRSNGSEGNVLLQLVSGGAVWTGTSSSVTRPGLGWQGLVFLGMAVPKHTTLKNCSRSFN